jgi:hypothetical protein
VLVGLFLFPILSLFGEEQTLAFTPGANETTFNTGAGTNTGAAVDDLAIDKTGNILVGGAGLRRYTTTGTLDTAFTANVGTNPTSNNINFGVSNSIVGDIVVQTTGPIIVATSGANSAKFLAGLSTTGILQSGFTHNGVSAGGTEGLALDSVNKIYAVGSWPGCSSSRIFAACRSTTMFDHVN